MPLTPELEHPMISSSTPNHGENIDSDLGEASSTVTGSGTSLRDRQVLHYARTLQSQLDTMSQRQDELIELVGALRGQQRGAASGPPDNIHIRGCGVSSRGPIQYGMPVATNRGGGVGALPFASNPNCPHKQGHLHNVPPHCHPMPAGLATWQTFPSRARARDPGQQTSHGINCHGRPMTSLPRPQRCTCHPSPYSVAAFNQLHYRTGHVVGIVHRGPLSPTGANPGVRQGLPPGWTRPRGYPPTPHPQPRHSHWTSPQVHTQAQNPMPMNRYLSLPPPPPHQEKMTAIEGGTSGTNQNGSSATQHGNADASVAANLPNELE